MPERDPETGHSSRLLRGLIWAGVLLAPLAAAVVLLGQSSGSVRFAVLLIAVSVVLIGASVLIRNDPVLQRMHVEDRVSDEIETLRRDLRAEFGRGGPPSDNSGFFRDAPMAPPADDPFPAAPRRQPDPGFAGGGRAAVPAPVAASAAVAAVRPPRPGPHGDAGFGPGPHGGPGFGPGPHGDAGFGPGPHGDPGFGPGPHGDAGFGPGPYGDPGFGPGPEFDEPSFGGRRGPGMTSGPRPVAASASIPAPRGAASVPASPAAPRATASVRPGGGQYGRADVPPADFGSNGYAAARVAGTYGSARVAPPDHGSQPAGVYGAPAGRPASNGYESSGAYEPSNEYGYGPDGYRDEGYADYSPVDPDVAGYGLDGGYDGPYSSGDPSYKARRHRPSANDTNVGTFADFAAYPGWSEEPEPDERYVQGYGPRRR